MKKVVVTVKDPLLIYYGVEQAKDIIVESIINSLKDEKFINYLGNRMSNALFGIAQEETSTIGSDVINPQEVNDYLSGFKVEINQDTIVLYNASVIDVANKKMSETTRANYPLQLSLAKLIEYGFGYTGFVNTEPLPEDWQYDINQHGYRGWYYEDSSGQIHWTNGMEGRLVFLKLCWWLENNFADIVYRYIKNGNIRIESLWI